MANITEWIAMGKPKVPQPAWVGGGFRLPSPLTTPSKTAWTCDKAAEAAASPQDRAEWFEVSDNCGFFYGRNDSAGDYLRSGVGGTGLNTVEAKKISSQYIADLAAGVDTVHETYKPTPPPTPKPSISPSTGANSGLPKLGISTTATKDFPMASSAQNTATLSSLGGIVGSLLPGGTIIGSGLGLLGGLTGKSKCSGPYDYNASTGKCVLKPASWGGWSNYPGGYPGTGGTTAAQSCPPGYVYDAASQQCKQTGVSGTISRILPGGSTGYVEASGWQSTTAYGTQGVVPQAVARQELLCPRGYVLYGKEPGMEVCLPKGMLPNKMRKWPKSPTPALSAQDMKTLRRINSLQKKIKRVAGTAGFSVRKR